MIPSGKHDTQGWSVCPIAPLNANSTIKKIKNFFISLVFGLLTPYSFIVPYDTAVQGITA
jgi:hypothetical protein